VIASFIRGLSVRDVEATLADALGDQAAISKSTVSSVCQQIKDDYEAWSRRRLQDIVVDYLFLDASFFRMHPGSPAEPAASEIDVSWQLQRIRGQLIHKKRTKADDDQSGDILPLPDICLAALELRAAQQDAEKEAAGDRWTPVRLSPSGLSSDDLVFTTPAGTNRDPRNFNRSFNSRCDKAGVRRIRVHDTRHTCASFLPALDVHPQCHSEERGRSWRSSGGPRPRRPSRLLIVTAAGCGWPDGLTACRGAPAGRRDMAAAGGGSR
jgi:hypothetical protein